MPSCPGLQGPGPMPLMQSSRVAEVQATVHRRPDRDQRHSSDRTNSFTRVGAACRLVRSKMASAAPREQPAEAVMILDLLKTLVSAICDCAFSGPSHCAPGGGLGSRRTSERATKCVRTAPWPWDAPLLPPPAAVSAHLAFVALLFLVLPGHKAV